MRELGVKATLAVFALIGGSLVIVGCKTSKTTASSQARETIPDKRLVANARTIVSNWNHTLPNSGQKIDQRAINHTLLAFKQMDLGDLPGAVASWDKAISIYSNIALLYDLRGSCKGMCGDYTGSLKDLDRAIVLDPSSGFAYCHRAETKIQLGDPAGAVIDCDFAILRQQDNALAYSTRAYARRMKNDWDGAIKDSNKALLLAPDCAPAYATRAEGKANRGDFNGAVEDGDKAVLYAPNSPFCYSARGHVKALMGNQVGAIADYSKAIELNPAAPDFYNNRGAARSAIGDVVGAIADYTAAIRVGPDYYRAYYNRGRAYFKINKLNESLRDYNRAIELKPDYVSAYRNRADTRVALGDASTALADVEMAIQLNPTSSNNAYADRAYLYYDCREFGNAAAELKRICDQNPEDDYAHFYLWLARSRLTNQAEATAELLQHLKKRPNDKANDWASQIGRFLTGQLPESDFIEAANRTDEAKLRGQQCEAFFYAGTKRLLMGDREMAAQYFEKCKATGQTDFTEYLSALTELERLRMAR